MRPVWSAEQSPGKLGIHMLLPLWTPNMHAVHMQAKQTYDKINKNNFSTYKTWSKHFTIAIAHTTNTYVKE